jgi:hypothetical protein
MQAGLSFITASDNSESSLITELRGMLHSAWA